MISFGLITRIRGILNTPRRELENPYGHGGWFPEVLLGGKSIPAPTTERRAPWFLQRRYLPFCIHFVLACNAAYGDFRNSEDYTLSADTTDAGGNRAVSANYSHAGSIGLVSRISAVKYPLVTAARTGLIITATSPKMDEGESNQLSAWAEFDDGTLRDIPASDVVWSVLDGPLKTINGSGLATANSVYQNTTASVLASYLGKTGTVELTVANVNPDDFESYAGDQIDDAWQVRYFGPPPNANAGPDVDFDGTGQTNLFKFLAALNPLDGSRMSISIESVPGQPGWKKIVFGPIVEDRNYLVTSSPSLFGGTFTPLGNSSAPVVIGDKLAITDFDASGPAKFYRVEITKP